MYLCGISHTLTIRGATTPRKGYTLCRGVVAPLLPGECVRANLGGGRGFFFAPALSFCYFPVELPEEEEVALTVFTSPVLLKEAE